MRSVARGDGAAAGSTSLTRYYAESGTPPGRWLGAGLVGLGDGAGVPVGSEVTHEQLFRLLGLLSDPVTGGPLGQRPRSFAGTAAGRPVAGFDLTMSVPKSVSVVWAIADAETQAVIHQAHRDAIDVVLEWAERNVVFTRTGTNGAVQEPTRGVIAAAFDHWDSRAGDPHLHTHVVIANRVQTLDGRWRTLDGRVLFRYTVALSEIHEGVLQDLLTDRLGYGWDERSRRHSPVPRHEITGVPDALIREFSRRSSQIEDAKNDLVDAFAATHGRQPSDVEVLRLRQQATLSTRPDKQHHSLIEQTASWRARASTVIGSASAGVVDTSVFARSLAHRSPLPAVTADGVEEAMLLDAAHLVLGAVGSKRATFRHANVLAEAHRQLHGIRFASPTGRVTLAERITAAALQRAVTLSDHPHRGLELFTTQRILDAETRLLDTSRRIDGPAASPLDPSTGHRANLGADQHAAVAAITGSGRMLDLLLGPAGTGKTSTLAAVRAAWEDTHGEGSVIGLAPSAAAADVLGRELGIETDNTAKWLHEQTRRPQRQAAIDALLDRINRTVSSPATALGSELYTQLDTLQHELQRWTLRAGQLVIIDEASLAGTLALDTITADAAIAGAKVLLVGDDHQLGAVEAGGAFAMLTRDRTDTPELTTVRRFRHEWERDASLQLRIGDPAAIDTYLAHDRIHSGNREDMLDAAHAAWRHDTDNGLTSLMIAADTATVAELNRRAQPARTPGEPSAPLADDTRVHAADRIVTRDNNRELHAGHGWVKNGDTWTIETVHDNGAVTAVRDSDHAAVTLPPHYVRDHVELGYATTTHRAQGRTVDTAHAIIDDRAAREALYVAATRGREGNIIYVAADGEHEEQETARRVLGAVAERASADTAALAIRDDAERSERFRNQPVGIGAPRISVQTGTELPDRGVGL